MEEVGVRKRTADRDVQAVKRPRRSMTPPRQDYHKSAERDQRFALLPDLPKLSQGQKPMLQRKASLLQLQDQVQMAYQDPFWVLVKAGDLKLLEAVSRNPAALRQRGSLGETPLHLLVLYKHFHLARGLAARYPELLQDQYQERLYHGETCLHIATVLGEVALVRFLLQICQRAGLLEQVLDMRADGEFFQRGKPCYYGETLLGFAVSTNQPAIVKDIVNSYGASLETMDSNGNNLLHLCVTHQLPHMYDTVVDLWTARSPELEVTGGKLGCNGRYCCVANAAGVKQYKNSSGATVSFAHNRCWEICAPDGSVAHCCQDEGSDGTRLYFGEWTGGENGSCQVTRYEPLSNRPNKEGLTPLCLASKLGHCDIFTHMLNRSCSVEWQFGPVTSLLLPLDKVDYVPGHKYGAVEHILKEGHHELLALPFMRTLLERKWRCFARAHFQRKFVKAATVATAFLVMVVSPCKSPRELMALSSQESLTLGFDLAIGCLHYLSKGIVVFGTGAKLTVEVGEMYEQGLSEYLGGIGGAVLYENIFSTSFCTLFLTSQVLALFDLPLERESLACSGLLCWFYLLWFLLGWSSTGHLVIMVWRILLDDFLVFSGLISIVLMAYSIAFYVVTTAEQDRNPTNFLSAFVDAFQMMTSGPEVKEDSSVGRTLMLFYGILVSVLLLNILVAMMNETFSRITEKAEDQWRMERARIIASVEQELSESQLNHPENRYWVEIHGQRFLHMEIVEKAKVARSSAKDWMASGQAPAAVLEDAK